ncbi:TPA: HNH endonuclease, partial [Enterococcus faecium]
ISKQGYNLEFTDNRISKYSMQNGKCAVTGEFLKADMIHCHHIIPKYLGGTDEFSNLVIIHPWVHQLIHSNDSKTIDKYLCLLKLNKKQIEKVNKYREKCNLTFI